MKNLKMTSTVFAAALLFVTYFAVANAGLYGDRCSTRDNAIRLVVKDVRSDSGSITVDLHGDDPSEFLKKGKKLLRVREPARLGEVEVCLPVRMPGVFAVVAYHDKNDNREFDRNWLGLPEEPFGISNNPGPFFAPPTHEEAAFQVGPDGATIEIDLRH